MTTARLNCIFKICVMQGEEVYRLVHLTLSSVVSGRTIKNLKEILRVKLIQESRNTLLRGRDLRDIVYLVPVDQSGIWLINTSHRV